MPFLAALPAIASVAGGIGSAVGAVGGLLGKNTSGASGETSGIRLGSASGLEQQATGAIGANFDQLQQFTDLGPGASDVTAGLGANRDLAALLQQYQQTGGAPSSQDIGQAQSFAGQMFAGQRIGAQQSALEAQQQFSQQAAIQGRGGLDPIFRNKVAQQQQQQEALIGANQGAFAAQQAQQFSQNRLGFAAQRSNVLGGLASQALSNRQALVGMGSQLQAAERNFRLASGEKYGTGSKTNSEPGGPLQALSGGLSGFASGVQAVGGIAKLFPADTTGSSANNPVVDGTRVAGPPRAPAGYSNPKAF